MIRVGAAPLHAVLSQLRAARAQANVGDVLVLDAPDPDTTPDQFDGELTPAGRARSWAGWAAVAEALDCVLTTPRPLAAGRVQVGLRVLASDGWHADAASGDPEKYGAQTTFARVPKFEDPHLLIAFERALGFVKPPAGARVLSVGCNQGEELAQAERLIGPCAALIGIDHAQSAIDVAKAKHVGAAYAFHCLDLREPLPIEPVDVIIAINTLHSPTLDGGAILRRLVRDHLKPSGAIILGLPNSRFVQTQQRLGTARRGQIFRDMAAHRRYLNQHRFNTLIVGKHTVLLAARRQEPR